MKLVKRAAAVRSYALYNAGARPAQWEVQNDAGETLYLLVGRMYGYRRSYRLTDLDGQPVGYSFGRLDEWRDELARHLNHTPV